jgi:hypothetical protein
MITKDAVSLPLDCSPTLCAYNLSHTRVAITDGSRLVVRAIGGGDGSAHPCSARDDDGDVSTTLVDASAHGVITSMCWVGLGQGHVIVCGTEKGAVMMYAEGKNQRLGVSNAGYGLVGEVKRYSTRAVVCVERVSGFSEEKTSVAVGYKDGVVRVFTCVGLDDAAMLRLDSVIQSPVDGDATRVACVASSSSASPSGSYRNGESLMVLLVGYVTDPSSRTVASTTSHASPKSLLHAYRYDMAHFRWENIHIGIEIDQVGCPGSRIAAISWAPLVGRREDLVAIAVGSVVNLYSLQGPVDDLRVDKVAALEHKDEVFSLNWNMTATWLAASTDGNEVCLWRPDLTGEWKMLNTIVGES